MSEDLDIKTISLDSLLSTQSKLLKQAARAIPHSFSKCTYDEPGGYIRQALYWCKTCTKPGELGKGICSACSVSCHADHEQLELFPKRAFRCDCPTSTVPVRCALHVGGTTEPPNAENQYNQNFRGDFCRCGRDYDPLTETETMIQCVTCEDWFHESCLNLRGTAVSRTPKSSPTKATAVRMRSSPLPIPPSSEPSSEPDYATEDEDYEDEDDADETLLIPPSGYDTFICGACVLKMPAVRRWAGTPGCRMIIRSEARETAQPSKAVDFRGWEVLGEHIEGSSADTPAAEGSTRKRSASPAPGESSSEPPAKKSRLDESASTSSVPSKTTPCKAPVPNGIAQQVFERLERRKRRQKEEASDAGLLIVDDAEGSFEVEGEGDLFLSDGWRERWCRCDDCLARLRVWPYLLEEEETYSPPEDPDSKKSLEELGLRALESLPRDKALDSIRAFNEMRDDLLAYLRPFAQEGKVVSEEDVTAFFEALKEGKKGDATV
ncbi:hypothetical protein FRC05_007640 [Tulasnella sp. 425]|nr:hypothetical protein FRC05_007640 [Tulasnella sp. 425]